MKNEKNNLNISNQMTYDNYILVMLLHCYVKSEPGLEECKEQCPVIYTMNINAVQYYIYFRKDTRYVASEFLEQIITSYSIDILR